MRYLVSQNRDLFLSQPLTSVIRYMTTAQRVGIIRYQTINQRVDYQMSFSYLTVGRRVVHQNFQEMKRNLDKFYQV
jgi:hypothetical protein